MTTFIPYLCHSLQMIFCEALFVVGLPKRKSFVLRSILCALFYFAATYGIMNIVYLFTGSFHILASACSFLVEFIITLIWIHMCFDIDTNILLFCGIGGYALQHLCYSVSTILSYFIIKDGKTYYEDIRLNILFLVFPYLIIGFLSYFTFMHQNKYFKTLKNEIDLRLIAIAIVSLFANIFLSSFDEYGTPVNLFVSRVICRSYGIISCVFCLFLLFGVSKWTSIRRENEILESMLLTERRQHELSKETIDIINLKCHDLKHQISSLANISNDEKRQKTIQEVGNAILIYNDIVQTGNDALDLILTEKSLLCEKYEIKFSVIADGKSISFIDSTDIFSLFGNALDNAIEYLKTVDKNHRIINLRIFSKEKMLFIHLDNYCEAILHFENDLPVTTKADRNFHGYGMKSIQYITSKYNGKMRINLSGNRFNLDLFFSI